MKNESLLQKARKVGKKNSEITDEHIELALAWARGEVSYSQIKIVLNLTSPSKIYSFLAFSLRKHIERQNRDES